LPIPKKLLFDSSFEVRSYIDIVLMQSLKIKIKNDNVKLKN